jgi:CRISPR system Cascade subunit CasE
MHAILKKSISDESRALWRTDNINGKTCVLLQSQTTPDLAFLSEEFDSEAETKSYSHFLSNLENSQLWRFRLTANPSHKVRNDTSEVYKTASHLTNEHQLRWLIEKSEPLGFSVVNSGTGVEIVQVKRHNFWHTNSYVQFTSVTYEGILKISDSENLISAMKNGIGREKAYGCGLLTLAMA